MDLILSLLYILICLSFIISASAQTYVNRSNRRMIKKLYDDIKQLNADIAELKEKSKSL